ncbi:MAG: hypothetical protein RSC29_06440 [Oscillospiraceae bacterium]
MKIGIISECQTHDKGILNSLFKRIKVNDENDEKINMIAVIPYTKDEFFKLKSGKKLRIVNMAEKALKLRGIEKVLYTKSIKIGLSIENSDNVSRFNLFDATWYAIKKCKITSENTVLKIVDKDLDLVDIKGLERFCMQVKTIDIYTENLYKATQISEQIADEYGLYINVYEYETYEKSKKKATEILIDVENNLVRIGRDFVINGAEYELGLNEYDIDESDVAQFLGEDIKKYRVKGYLSGKNKLTI